MKERELKWHPVEYEDFSEVDKYILLSFENYTQLAIGRFDGDDDNGYAFYAGDDDEPISKYGLIVNAWMPLPERYEG